MGAQSCVAWYSRHSNLHFSHIRLSLRCQYGQEGTSQGVYYSTQKKVCFKRWSWSASLVIHIDQSYSFVAGATFWQPVEAGCHESRHIRLLQFKKILRRKRFTIFSGSENRYLTNCKYKLFSATVNLQILANVMFNNFYDHILIKTVSLWINRARVLQAFLTLMP